MMARSLGIVDQVRGVGASLGITVIEPENTKQNTMCCGGPIEYAFPELSRGVSGLRIRELAKISTDILVACPVCLMNLYRYEKEMGLRVRDMGEVLYEAANGETPA
jgi:Fe-S oxidoreductase